MWLVVVEARYNVVRVCVSGNGFYIPGQEPCWDFAHVTEWVREISPTSEEPKPFGEFDSFAGFFAEAEKHTGYHKELVKLKADRSK